MHLKTAIIAAKKLHADFNLINQGEKYFLCQGKYFRSSRKKISKSDY